MNSNDQTAAQRPSFSTRMFDTLALLSVFMLLLVFACFFGRFDFCMAITVFPPWSWFIAGLLLTIPSFFHRARRTNGVVILLWFVFMVVFIDSPTCLLRTFASGAPTRALRVVTLNCEGSGVAAEEVSLLDADIVLLQESPTRREVEELADAIYGDRSHAFWSADTSILTRGQLTPVDVAESLRGNFLHARIEFEPGHEVDVICLRLLPSPVRIDLWSPGCWATYTRNRQWRRKQLEMVAARIKSIPAGRPIVCGGDFNAPPGDAVYRLLRPRLRDAFPIAGRGWGRTIVNDFPFFRIDQVWTSEQLQPIDVFASATQFSDHRMVVCDLNSASPSDRDGQAASLAGLDIDE